MLRVHYIDNMFMMSEDFVVAAVLSSITSQHLHVCNTSWYSSDAGLVQGFDGDVRKHILWCFLNMIRPYSRPSSDINKLMVMHSI